MQIEDCQCASYDADAGTLPELWSRLTDLSIVTVAGNRLTGTIPSAWERLSVVEMDLGRNNLSGRLSEGLVRNWNCSDDGDAILHVAANALTGASPCILIEVLAGNFQAA